MTNFDNMEQNFVALTEEELTDVNGVLAGDGFCRYRNWLGIYQVSRSRW